ncbi:MAG: hypothetical protein WB492_05585 [Christiangramia sp.]
MKTNLCFTNTVLQYFKSFTNENLEKFYVLKVYVENLGAKEKYNETLTIAGIKVVNHFYLKTKMKDFMIL